MESTLSPDQQQSESISVLRQFIRSNPEARELKRALAVKMAFEEYPYWEIADLLEVTKSFISYWKRQFLERGIAGLKLGYRGAQSYLKPEERQTVIDWLRASNEWDFEELVTYIEVNYGVVYQSKQSYYDLFSEAGISWKKSQKMNPKSNPSLVQKKTEELQKHIGDNQSKIESGEKVVLFVDESHLCWGDTCGYVWGRSDSRIEIPITNSKERQTYYGALNYHTKEFILEEYDAGNGENTKKFMELLQNKYSGKQITLIWDGASYHRCEIIKSFLASVNDGKPKDEWPLTCILFAPHDPRQNPVEDVWLRGKNFLRRMWSILESFEAAKSIFKFYLQHEVFDFAKIHKYSPCSVLG